MIEVTKYKNSRSPDVSETLTIEEVFKIIKIGDSVLTHIKYARSFDKNSEDYDAIKTGIIPTFRFNFIFDKRASNNNITEPTGLIYLDIDNTEDLPSSEFIFAKWKSLSLTGYCILVKVNNLSIDNFNDCYDKLSSLLNINSDIGARKPTQQTIQSYDPNIYVNHNSRVFNCIRIEKVPSPIKQKKEKGCLTGNDTFLLNYQNIKVRYNNIDDYFNDNDLLYKVFREEKEKLCIPFIPRKVEKGNRNSYLFLFLSQIVALNPLIHKAYLKALADTVNGNVMKPKLSDNELFQIIDSIFRIKESNKLKKIYNKERRIIFNPKHKITFKEKMKIVNKELGSIKSMKTTENIYECIEEWDFQSNGKITQENVANMTGLSISTIKRYWHNFKSYVKELNDDYKESTFSNSHQIECRIDYDYISIASIPLKKSA